MSDDKKQQAGTPGDPREAQPGKGASGDQWAVQTAQTTSVNPDDETIPSGSNVEQNREQIKAYAQQEEGTDLPTTHGYTVDESGRLDNFAIEPPMYVEE